jgi:large conductance mechanosensitive channel
LTGRSARDYKAGRIRTGVTGMGITDPLKKVTSLKPLSEFKAFLTKSNTLALAIAVVIGTAVGKVVSSIVGDLIMPLISLVPGTGGSWREWSVGPNSQPGKDYVGVFKLGNFLGSVVDFVIVAFVVFMITKILLREKKADPTTKACPECLEQVPLAAKRCRACTSTL